MSELVSVANRVQVPSATPDDYVVPPPLSELDGVTRDFNDGTVNIAALGNDAFTGDVWTSGAGLPRAGDLVFR